MKKKLLIFLLASKLSPLKLSKLEIEKFEKDSVEIKVHEMIDIINLKFKKTYASQLDFKYLRSFESLSEWKKELIKLLKEYKKENILIMSEIRITDWNTFRINQFIKGNKIRTIEFTDLEAPFYDYKFKSLKKKLLTYLLLK